MGSPRPQPKLDFAAYLQWEEGQQEKHEYLAGEVHAMTGARRAHVRVAVNLATAMQVHLRGTPCSVYASDMKLRIEALDAAFYPDVMVECDAAAGRGSDLYLERPVLVIEVLSDSTAAHDRGTKAAAYRRLTSLKEYTFIDITARRVECYRRDASDHWVLFEFAGEGSCDFTSIGLTMPLDDLFEGAGDQAATVAA